MKNLRHACLALVVAAGLGLGSTATAQTVATTSAPAMYGGFATG